MATEPPSAPVAWTLAAVIATASVHVWAARAAVPSVDPQDLHGHAGERVRLAARVTWIDPSREWTRIDGLADGVGVRLMVPPNVPLVGVVRGAELTVDGSVRLDEGRAVLFVSRVMNVESAVPDAVPVAHVAARAPELVGGRVTVAGNVTVVAGGAWLTGDGRSLALAGDHPSGPGPAVAVGRVVYDASSARYEFEAEAWRPWTPS